MLVGVLQDRVQALLAEVCNLAALFRGPPLQPLRTDGLGSVGLLPRLPAAVCGGRIAERAAPCGDRATTLGVVFSPFAALAAIAGLAERVATVAGLPAVVGPGVVVLLAGVSLVRSGVRLALFG